MNLEFFIKLKEMVSSGLVKMAATAKNTSEKIRGANGTLAQSYDELKSKIAQLESSIGKSKSLAYIREARRELAALQQQANISPGNLNRSGGGLLALARNYIGPLAIAGAATGVFSAGARAEQNLVGLRTFLGAGAEQAYTNIQKDAAATPFDTQSLLMANRSLITAGLSAEAARKDVMNLANAVAATGGGNDELARMSINLQQIKNTGKATGVDIKQFAYAGINIYGALAAATGKSTEEVKDMEVSYELLSLALDKAAQKGGIFEGALAAQAKTISGRWNTMIDNIKIGAADIGTALQPMLHGFLDVGAALVSTIVPAFVSTINWMKENWSWLGFLVSILGSALIAYKSVILVTQLWTAAQTLLNVALTLNPIGLVVAGIAALIAGVVYAWNKFEGFRGVLYGVWEVGKLLADVFIGLGKTLIGALTFDKDLIKEGFIQQAKAISEIANGGIVKRFNAGYDKGVASMADTSAATPTTANVTDAFSAAKPQAATATESDTVKGITGGGPRVVNININKLVEKIEVHAASVKEGMAQIQDDVEETLLRVLHSGATTQ
jgi:tape measure domain-containing protein